MTRVVGRSASGKHSFALEQAALKQQNGGIVLWIDAKARFNRDFVLAKGVSLDDTRFLLFFPNGAPNIAGILSHAFRMADNILVVLDGVGTWISDGTDWERVLTELIPSIKPNSSLLVTCAKSEDSDAVAGGVLWGNFAETTIEL
jgi:hypothetical protein